MTLDYEAMWPDEWVRASETFMCAARVHLPDKSCREEKVYGERATRQLLLYIKPRFTSSSSTPKGAGKGEPCFFLNGGNNHATDYDKVLHASGTPSYSAHVAWGYRLGPCVGLRAT